MSHGCCGENEAWRNHNGLFCCLISVKLLPSAQVLSFGIESTYVAVRLLARRWGVWLSGSVCLLVCVSRLVHGPAVCCIMVRETFSFTRMLCSFGSCWMVMWAKICFQICNTGTQILKWVKRKHQSDGVQTAGREREDCEEENSVCFWLLLHSYVWIHHRCFSLSSCARLLYLNLKQPMSQSSVYSFLLHPLLIFPLSMSAAFPLYSLLSCL